MKKTKPKTIPRHHEIKVDELVERGRKSVLASRQRVLTSKIMNDASRKLIEESRRNKKKK